MSNLTNFAENKVADALFRGQALTAPATYYIALFTTATGETGTGATEVTGGSYARASIASSLANWEATQGGGSTAVSSGTSGIVKNLVPVTYTDPTADWGLCTHVGFFDAPTGGNMWLYGPLAVPKTVLASSLALQFAIGELTVTVN